MLELLVFTAADRRYEPFVLPYMVSVLWSNPDTIVEVCVEDEDSFRREFRSGLEVLERHCAGRFAISTGRHFDQVSNTVRFLETPRNQARYVYIGDIDILVLERIAPDHIENMRVLGLPYSNIQRPSGKKALSGLHFSDWDAYYPLPNDYPKQRINLDECFLYDLIVARGLGLPDPSHTFRPLHGYHMSLNRDPRIPGVGGWGYTRNRSYALSFNKLRQSDLWRDSAPCFSPDYLKLLYILEVSIAFHFPDLFESSSLSPMPSVRSLFITEKPRTHPIKKWRNILALGKSRAADRT